MSEYERISILILNDITFFYYDNNVIFLNDT